MKVFLAVLFIMYVSQHASAVVVEVNEGVESVVLPCQVKGPVSSSVVEWRRSNPSMTVHVRRNGRDQPNDQNELYRGRTELRQDAEQSGDLSLTLKTISLVDAGTYTCSNCEVQLQVTSRNELKIRKVRNVFIGLFTVTLLLLLGCVGYIVWMFITSKNSKDTTAANL